MRNGSLTKLPGCATDIGSRICPFHTHNRGANVGKILLLALKEMGFLRFYVCKHKVSRDKQCLFVSIEKYMKKS